jgi:hypothetical protein
MFVRFHDFNFGPKSHFWRGVTLACHQIPAKRKVVAQIQLFGGESKIIEQMTAKVLGL